MADILQNRLKEYEAEKGRNIATKEDIEEITKQIETVKNEISFVSQRKKDYIVERKRHLLNLLYYAEKISNGQNSLHFYARSCSEYEFLYTLIDRINETSLDMTHEFHILITEYEDFENEKIISNIIDNCSLLAVEIITTAHNAALTIKEAQNCFEQAKNNSLLSGDFTRQALELNTKVITLVKEPLAHKEDADKAVNQYIKWLRKLFGKGLNFEYNLAKPQLDVEP